VGSMGFGASVRILVDGSALGLRVGYRVGSKLVRLLPGHDSGFAHVNEAKFRASLAHPSIKLP